MKYASLLFVAAMIAQANAQQFTQFKTVITCDSSRKKLVNDAEKKIKATLQTMVKEGMLINFMNEQNTKKNKIRMSYTLLAENEGKQKTLNTELKKRLNETYPDVFKVLWKECPHPKDTISNTARLMFPAVKNLWAMVVAVDGIDELPDPTLEYNMVFDFTAIPTVGENKFKMDSTEVNWGLTDIGRIYNLHVAAGIPKEKIHFVVAVHAFAARSFLKNDEYKKRFKIDNPNLSIIDELDKVGVKFLVCGQSLSWMGDKKEMLLPQAKVSLTAQTTLSSYQLKGYALKSMGND
ncbi:MAG TPA: DsrE family protein [Cyclobacteriaceae bacterium]|jgi:intracellular sulfur oxidation DsrE/DsrF family protein|nr:DsrE family protein [Cyclobacteriaceae bacterium]